MTVTCSIFVMGLLFCPAAYILDKAGIIEVTDMANYKDPEKTYGEEVPFNGLFNMFEQAKADLENIYTNYLPFYGGIVDAVLNIDNSMKSLLLSMLNDTGAAESVEPVSSDSSVLSGETDDAVEASEPPVEYKSVFVGKDDIFNYYSISSNKFDDFIDCAITFSEKKLYAGMKEELEHLNRIAAADDGVRFFVYIAQRMQDTPYFNEAVPDEICTYSMFHEFLDGISGADAVGYFNIETIEKRVENVFRTDHHWNAAGSYGGYTDIASLMGSVIPNIGEVIPLKGIVEIPGVQFRGSAASRSQYGLIYESFAALNVDLPEQRATEKLSSNLTEYLRGSFNKNFYASHYELMYPRPQKSIITYPENNTGRRLLIIGDSYTYCISGLIASHFDKTYMYYVLDGKTLNYEKFIEDNGITDVLVLMLSHRIFQAVFNGEKGSLNQIKTY